MAKITLNDVANLTGQETSAVAAINNNNSEIETAIENTLSRDGTSPNAMNADFDMNGNDILNVGTINVETTITVGGEDIQNIVGVQGPKGDTGDTGPAGPQGAGLTILGTLANEGELPGSGSTGDAYLIDGDLYVWTGSDWEDVGNVQGPQGETGTTGATGATGATGVGVADAEVVGDNLIVTLTDTTTIDTGNVRGPQGDTGSTGATGATGPAGADGADGADGVDGIMASVVAGTGIDVDATDPANPIVSIESLTVSSFAASAVVTEAEGISSNDNDSTVPTSAAVKDYVDSSTPTVDAATTSAAGIVELATAAEWRTGTDTGRALVVSETWSSAAEVTLADAATIDVDGATFINATVTLSGNRTLGTWSNAKVGQSGYLRVVQDGTGSRTLAYHADYEFAGGVAPTLSTTAAAQDMLFYQVIASGRVLLNIVKDIS